MSLANMNEFKKTIKKVKLGKDVKIYDFVNLYECEIGDETMIGAFVEIQKEAKIGRRCRIQSHSFICEGVTIEDNVFIGHGVVFINDKHPSVEASTKKIYKIQNVTVKKGAVVGSGAVIMAGVTIGKKSFVGAGAVVTRDVPDGTLVVGAPARVF